MVDFRQSGFSPKEIRAFYLSLTGIIVLAFMATCTGPVKWIIYRREEWDGHDGWEAPARCHL